MKVRKILALILAFAMIMSTTSFTAFAENGYVAMLAGTDIYFENLNDAFTVEHNPEGKSVLLIADCTQNVDVVSGGAYTFYLAGYTITGTFKTTDGTVHINGVYGNSGKGTIQNTGVDGNYPLYNNQILGGNNLDVTDCNIIATEVGGTAVYSPGDKTNIRTADVVGNIEVADGGVLNISNGTFNGEFVVEAGSSLNISGGTFTSNPADYIASGYSVVNNGNEYLVKVTTDITVDDAFEVDSEGAYLLKTAEDVELFRVLINTQNPKVSFGGKTFKLTNDIDLTGKVLDVVGNDSHRFGGTFDGQNYKIIGLNVDGGDTANVGFVGMTYGATFKNVTFENITVKGGSYTGGVVGFTRTSGATVFENVNLAGDINIQGTSHTAGIVGGGQVDISDCSVSGTGTISGTWDVGGIVGLVSKNSSFVKNTTVSGMNIDSENGIVGGIAGRVISNGMSFAGNTVSDTEIVCESGASYNMAYGMIFGATQIEGGELELSKNVVEASTLTVEGVEKSNFYNYNNYDGSSNDTTGIKVSAAKIGSNEYYTLAEAFNAVSDGDVIELGYDVVINEGSIKFPQKMTNVTLKGNDTAVIKDTVLMSADGNSYSYSGLTVDGVVFDNSSILITGWRTGGAVLENITIKNNVFKNIVRTGNEAAIHFNLAETEAVKNLTVENNIIDGVSGNQNSGLYVAVDGDTVIKGNVINNVTFRPFIIQIIDNNGNDDSLVVTGNTFAGSPNGRLQAYGSVGSDKVEIEVNENIITGTSNSHQICFWNFGEANTSFDFSNNYYEYNPVDNFNKFYINGSTTSYAGLDKYEVFPYYTELNADGTINADSLYDGTAEGISVEYIKVDSLTTEESLVYDIALVAENVVDEEFINRLNSADLTFALTTDDDIAYEILEANSEIAVNPVYNAVDGSIQEGRYEFHYKNKDSVKTDTAKSIVIGRVKFTGYGDIKFGVKTAGTNAAHATTIDDNIVSTYVPNGNVANGQGILYVDSMIDTFVAIPTRKLVINVAFPNGIEANAKEYQDMKVTVEGPDNYKTVIDFGNGTSSENLQKAENGVVYYSTDDFNTADKEGLDLVLNTAYTVTLEGAGYRTVKYTVSMTESKTLNFWNNVKDNKVYVETSESGIEKYAQNVTFLAGDIVKDNDINIYDLSAVVSYFGEIDLNTDNKVEYAKYDLNRDGKIDSKDVAYVLVSWGN